MNITPKNIDILRYFVIKKIDWFAAFLDNVEVYGWNCGAADVTDDGIFNKDWLNSPIDTNWFSEEEIKEFYNGWWSK